MGADLRIAQEFIGSEILPRVEPPTVPACKVRQFPEFALRVIVVLDGFVSLEFFEGDPGYSASRHFVDFPVRAEHL